MEAVTARQLPVKQQREKVSEFDNELEQEASNVITAYLGERQKQVQVCQSFLENHLV
jgi:primosomal protein N''